MVFPTAFLKAASHWLRSCRQRAKRGRAQLLNSFRSLSTACDFQSALLTAPSFFPFFMLVAFEAGGLLRSLLLLSSYPLVLAVGPRTALGLRIMAFISFCGLPERDARLAARSVLPKFFLESLDERAYRSWAASPGRKTAVTVAPRVMVEPFVKEYLAADEVHAAEMNLAHFSSLSFFTGFITPKRRQIRDFNPFDHTFLSLSKQTYTVTRENNNGGSFRGNLPRENYPKPLIFHDGRLAFLPTPSSMLALFLWLPLGIFLFIIRAAIGHFLPYRLTMLAAAFTGFRIRVGGLPVSRSEKSKGILFVCNHRTLLDPLIVSGALRCPLTAVTYSLSPISELISPIRTTRLTRDRKADSEKIARLLAESDLVVCPEGTTCREPYLLRFSALFAELAEDMVPVAVDTHVSMFYGTTASGYKCFDPVFFLMNPRPEYVLRFLGHVPPARPAGPTAVEVANGIQRKLADALGFECTSLTRKDKYLMLAGNDGVSK